MTQELTPTPSISERRDTIDQIDTQIIALMKQRSEVSQAIVAERLANGGTRIAQDRERKVVNRFEEALGAQGIIIAMAALALGRGTLHHEPESE